MAIAVVIGAAEFVPAPPASMSATHGLVAAYGFEEGSGTVVADASGSGNDGSILNAAWSSAGMYGGALSFDGSSARVIVPDSASLHLRHMMTLEAWVKPSAISDAWRDVVYKGDDNYYLEAMSTTSGLPAAGGVFHGDGHRETFGTVELSTGAWAYLAETYDGSALRLYVDGNEVSSVPETATLRSSAQPLEIGGDGIYGQYFQGLIDEVRVYNAARSPDEIRLDMATPVVPGTPADVEPPSVPGTLSASAASSSEVDLSWGAATDNVGATGYEVFRCLGDGCTDLTRLAQLDGTSTSYPDTTVAQSSSYSYQVRAVDAAGNTGDFSNTASAQTPASTDTQPPSAPTGLSVSSADQTSLALVWNASSDNVGVAGYGVYKDGPLVASPTDTGYTLTGLLCGTSYTIAVDAYDAAGNRSDKTTITTSTAACPDTQPPSVPGTLSASAASSSEVDLSWGAATDNVGVAGYEVFRCLGDGCTDFARLAQLDGTSTSYPDTTVAQSSSYSYQVRAVDAAGNTGDFSNTASAQTPASTDTQPPSAPTGLSVSSADQTSLALVWNASSDNVGVAGYGVYKDGPLVASPTDTGYTLTGLLCGTSYTIAVDAYDAAGNRSAQTTITTSTAACPDTQPPSVPGTLSASAASSSEVDLSWGAATDNVGVAGYEVFRCLGDGCTDFARLAQLDGTSTSYPDTTVAAEQQLQLSGARSRRSRQHR